MSTPEHTEAGDFHELAVRGGYRDGDSFMTWLAGLFIGTFTPTERSETVTPALLLILAIVSYARFFSPDEQVRAGFALAIMLFGTMFLIDVAYFTAQALRRRRAAAGA
jgi:hypothetical protein